MTGPILRLDKVHTHIGQYHILQGVTFDVPEGAFTVIVGRNGAGKTTTLRTILGLWKASAGSIRFRDAEISRLDTSEISRAGIAYVPESMGIFGDLTVRENMLLAARTGRFDKDRLDWVLGLFPPLRKFWGLAAGNLSGGQKQMLSIARAIIEPRELLLVDEPTKGIAPAIIEDMIDAFLELKRMNTTVVLVEQNFGFASALGDTVVVMDDGRAVHRGAMSDLAADQDLQQKYLGLSLHD
ncbi:ABC transporter ATP-binding protein [Futiania mangrovi]|uniref:ABC transporter ATP-binding protein n=1 Tax=Futiania mangrovi TaxID=2959716 RepID=A0A9J6PC90_9PROT|nr:ABC transporter ATP-binding protein [Futiania mangrovii]MCP1337828.1 ABC transporter ATP-binding protein [Futiania mangrovii]